MQEFPNLLLLRDFTVATRRDLKEKGSKELQAKIIHSRKTY